MILRTLLSAEHVLFHPAVTDKASVIQTLVDAGPWETSVKEEVRRAVLERESIMATGVGNGIAIPHAKVKGVIQPVVLACILEKPLDYGSFDGAPVDIVFMVIGPEGQDGTHLKTLSRLSRLLIGAGFRQKLREAQNAHDVYTLITDPEGEHVS